MKNCIIGIAGQKQAGKDTVANIISYIFRVGLAKANYTDWYKNLASNSVYAEQKKIHFADVLKQVLSLIYDIDIAYFNQHKYKDDMWYCLDTGKFISEEEVNNKVYHRIDINKLDQLMYPGSSIKVTLAMNINIGHRGQMFNVIKLRTLLQYFGTDICRNHLGENIWIQSAMSKAIKIAETTGVCIIPDVRFKNEEKAIRQTNQSKFLYGGLLMVRRNNNSRSEHISEDIDVDYDYLIDNNTTLMKLFYKVLEIVQKIKDK